MVVFNTIIELLRFKTSASYSEIASVSGVKKIEVLKILNNNIMYIRQSKNGNVLRLCRPYLGTLYESFHNHMMHNDFIAQVWKE